MSLWQISYKSIMKIPKKRQTQIHKICQRGSKFDVVFFLFNEGREDPNTTVSVPTTARQRNAINMSFGWGADDGPKLNAGLVAL